MKKSTKAALLSALVFPGVGHMYLKKYIPGVVLFVTSFAGFYLIISKTVERALQIVEKIQSGDIEPDVAAIMESVSRQSTETGAYLVNIASAIFIICWLIGIFDSYRIGYTRDKNDKALVNKQKEKQGNPDFKLQQK